MNNTTTKFAERLREMRGGRKQHEMAMLLNVEQASYCGWEAGRRQPKLDDFARMCRTLRVSADWMLGIDDGKPMGDAVLSGKISTLRQQADKATAEVVRIRRELEELEARTKS